MYLKRVVTIFLIGLALPVTAQTVDFGDDSSIWANDGECGDPRFQGPGMTQTPLLDSDISHDATDCSQAFEAGRVTLVNAEGSQSPKTGSKVIQRPTIVDGINFGDDSGDWIRDGECDDRRFFGQGMATSISWDQVGRDSTDCVAAYQAGTVKLWDFSAARAATVCASIDFGDDTGPYPHDYECDDRRFEGPGSAMNLSAEYEGSDASDCSRLCAFGVVFLREYE